MDAATGTVLEPDTFKGAGLGHEHSIDALGCDPAALRSIDVLSGLFDRVIAELDLHAIETIWHQFPEPAGITGLALLGESHLTVHTFPEVGAATINLYSCRPKPDWPW